MGAADRPFGDVEVQKILALSDPATGWWFHAVLDAFAYLEADFGYRLAIVHQHFRGNFVLFAGTASDLVISYDPEDTGHVGAEFWISEGLPPVVDDPKAAPVRVLLVNDLLSSRMPNLRLPDLQRSGIGKEEALDAIDAWAVGLREGAADILRGAPATGRGNGARDALSTG